MVSQNKRFSFKIKRQAKKTSFQEMSKGQYAGIQANSRLSKIVLRRKQDI